MHHQERWEKGIDRKTGDKEKAEGESLRRQAGNYRGLTASA